MRDETRAIMLGIRHRCGQEVQFWIPTDLVSAMADRIDGHTETLNLSEWMQGEGILPGPGLENAPQEVLVDKLKDELAPRGVAFINVDADVSRCPRCGALLQWLEILADYATNA